MPHLCVESIFFPIPKVLYFKHWLLRIFVLGESTSNSGDRKSYMEGYYEPVWWISFQMFFIEGSSTWLKAWAGWARFLSFHYSPNLNRSHKGRKPPFVCDLLKFPTSHWEMTSFQLLQTLSMTQNATFWYYISPGRQVHIVTLKIITSLLLFCWMN